MSTILWRQRNLLELLLFKLEEERLVVSAGLDRWLPRATREVELVLAELQRIEEPRARELDSLAVELGLEPGRSLDVVAAAAPPPWDGLLEQHRQAFLATAQEIGPLRHWHRDQLGMTEVDAAMAWLEATGSDGRAGGSGRPGLRLVDDA